METKELLLEIQELLDKDLRTKCNGYYLMYGELCKYKGQIKGRKILSKFANDMSINSYIDTSVWYDEELEINNYKEQLLDLESDIKKLIQKIKIIKLQIEKPKPNPKTKPINKRATVPVLDEILPCSICKSEAQLFEYSEIKGKNGKTKFQYDIECEEGHNLDFFVDDKESAIYDWNQRNS